MRKIDGPLPPFEDAESLRQRLKSDAKHEAFFRVLLDGRNATARIMDNTSLPRRQNEILVEAGSFPASCRLLRSPRAYDIIAGILGRRRRFSADVMDPTPAKTNVAKRQAHVLSCPQCGLENPHRMERRGFLEKRIYSIFGYFPWRCSRCESRFYLRKRYQKHRQSPPTR
jgi:uncharacterized C2H2 Zn-finger protein